MEERLIMKKYLKKILRGIGRRMIDWSKTQESCEHQSIDYRWMDPQNEQQAVIFLAKRIICLLYTSPSPRDGLLSRMPSSA